MEKDTKEKKYSQKTIKFYYRNPDLHIERVLWYISYLHKKVWNQMLDICNGNFELIDTILEKINPKGQEEIQKLKDSLEVITRPDGTTYNKSKSLSEFGMLYALGPVRNADYELLQISALDAQKPAKVLAKSWKSFYELVKRGDNKARPPRYKNDQFFYTLQSDQVSLEKKNGDCNLKINHKISGVGEILIPLPKYVGNLLMEKKVRFVTIKRTHPDISRASDFEINLVYETELVEKKTLDNTAKIAGVDVGARRITIAVSADPNQVKTYHLRPHDIYFTKKRAEIEKKMKGLKKGSKRYRKLADTITKMTNKWHNCQKDSQRKVAADMIKHADMFYVGVEKVRLGLAQSENGNATQHRGVQNTGNMARMVTYITEKSVEQGKYVFKVPDHKPVGKNDKKTIKIIGAVRNFEYGISSLDKL